jgi:N4-gp56 family major capsid protein
MFEKINLQLFADADDGVNRTTDNPKTTGTTNDLSPEMKTFYDKVLLREAQANLVHDQFGQKRNIPKNGGKNIEFRKFDSLPKQTTPLTEGVTPDGKKLNVTAVTATVEQFGDYVVQSDVLELTSIDNTIVEATRILGNQAGLTLDAIVRNKICAATDAYYSATAGGTRPELPTDMTAECKFTVDDVKRAVALLKRFNTPKIDGYYVGIIHPDVSFDLTNDPAWIDVQKYATPENMLTGEIGKIHGCRFVESTEALVEMGGSDGKLPIYNTLIFGRDAYGTTEVEGGGLQIIVKQKGSAGTADPLDQRSSIGWKALKTAEIRSESYMVRFVSASSLEGGIANKE